MSRIFEIRSFVKRDLQLFDQKSANIPQINFALNKAQEQIIFREEILEFSIPITIVSGTALYTTSYQISVNPAPLRMAYPKRVKSWKFPPEWKYNTTFKTPQEFDEIKSKFTTLIYPLYAIIKPNTDLEFYAPPGDDVATKIIYLKCVLKKQTQDASDTIDFEVESIYDTALRYYANYYLLPLEHPSRNAMLIEFENELKKYHNQLLNREGYDKVIDCTE